jgi:predicted signal transduction protein with EAL and GGDEF domain
VGRDPRAAAIVRHTVALAHDLGLTLVAEGVEDAETGTVLAGLGCDTAQGYAIRAPCRSRPSWGGWGYRSRCSRGDQRPFPRLSGHLGDHRARARRAGAVEDRRPAPGRPARGGSSPPPSRRSPWGCAVPGDRAG